MGSPIPSTWGTQFCERRAGGDRRRCSIRCLRPTDDGAVEDGQPRQAERRNGRCRDRLTPLLLSCCRHRGAIVDVGAVLQAEHGNTEALLLLFDVAEVTGNAAHQLFQAIHSLAKVIA
jgi:hypothetical protein